MTKNGRLYFKLKFYASATVLFLPAIFLQANVTSIRDFVSGTEATLPGLIVEAEAVAAAQ